MKSKSPSLGETIFAITACAYAAFIWISIAFTPVDAHSSFQFTAKDCAFASREIGKGHPDPIWKLVNETHSSQVIQDDVAARSLRVVYQERMEAKLEYTNKRAQLQKAVEDGDIIIEVDGTDITIGTVTTDGTRIRITTPTE